MKIAVTSVTGQLGNAIANNLIAEISKENVIGIARTPEKAKNLGIEIRKGDYNSRELFNEALKGVDALLLVSGNDAPENRIAQHRNVIEAAKQNGVKKIVYTSILGKESDTAFSPVVNSNRQTEEDVKTSGLEWVIGRNGIYIEPDLEYVEQYKKEGKIRNCAGERKCGYTSRPELGFAYAKMLIEDKHNHQVYNLAGNAITQSELATVINTVYGTDLSFQNVTVEEYTQERKEALGDFMGTIIAGIYQSMLQGAYEVTSDFEIAAGRPHQSPLEMIKSIKNKA